MKRVLGLQLVLIFLLGISILLAVTFGSAKIKLGIVYEILFSEIFGMVQTYSGKEQAIHDIIWYLRMPRIILGSCIGAGLSVCGVIMQAIVKNPLADPYILGVSSGASLGATSAILLGAGTFLGENFVGIAAFMGAFAISLAVLIISNIGGRSNSIKLLLAGMALSAVCSAFTSFIVYFANNKEGIQNLTYWLMGSMAGAKWELLQVVVPLTICSVLFFWSQARILNLMLLGDDVSITLGRDLHLYRQCYLLISSLIVGFSVYSAGMIGFVGLVVPHVVRMLLGTDHKYLIPTVAFAGAIFVIWADVLCRIVIPRAELPIGILISLIGAPCFVYLMIKRAYGFGSR